MDVRVIKEDENKSEYEKQETRDKPILDIKSMFIIYIHEFVQVFVSILIIRIAMEKEIHLGKTVYASMVIGLITSILENYNSDFTSNIKQGITFSAGSQLMAGFMN